MRHAALVPGLLLLALSFSAAWAGGPKKGGGTPATPPPAAPVDPVAALTEEDINKALEPYFQAAMKGDRDAALDALIVLLDDPAQSVYHGVAYARLADSVRDLEQPYAALIAAGQAISLDPTRGAGQVKPSLKIAAEVHDLAYLEGVFAKNVGLDVDAETRTELAWLAARGAYADGQLSTALGILALVNKDNPYYAKGQALKGVILNRQGKYSEAMAALLIAESLSSGDPELQDVVRLNLARTYYAAENYTRSIEYYAMVSRASPAWPDASLSAPGRTSASTTRTAPWACSRTT
jgi:tetratricopeptide (TPR) repeat protein